MAITNLIEGQRGCGYRKKGGLYLMGGIEFSGCCKLAAPLHSCPTCGNGIKFSRGFTWISTGLFPGRCRQYENQPKDITSQYCILSNTDARIGLMWVGEKFYNTPQAFMNEARVMGVSKRIAQLPKDCKVGETWIALAHRKCSRIVYAPDDIEAFKEAMKNPQYSPAVFMIFKLTGVQYVVNGDETAEELQRMEKRNIDLVTITRAGEQTGLNL